MVIFKKENVMYKVDYNINSAIAVYMHENNVID